MIRKGRNISMLLVFLCITGFTSEIVFELCFILITNSDAVLITVRDFPSTRFKEQHVTENAETRVLFF